MSFKQYRDYRPSGVDWLGAVPSHWSVLRLKWSTQDCRNGIWGDDPGGEDDIICVRVADFDRVRLTVCLDEPTLRSVSDKERARRLLRPGDLLLEKSGGGEQQPVGCVVLFDDPRVAICSNFVARIRLAPGQDPSYWRYLHAAVYSARVNTKSIKQNTGIQNLDAQQYFDESAPFPPFDEQKTIATFLDGETAKIDELILAQERLISLLREKREALISYAVTNGLNSRVSTKDTGIEGLGQVPKHWRVSKMKWVAQMESGHTPDKKVPEYWEMGDIPWVSLNDTGYLKDNDFITETAYKITLAGIANSSAHLLPARAVVFSRDATIGRCAITTKPMAVSQHFIAWICGPLIMPEFLLLRLRSMTQELDRLTTGATIKTIGMPEVRTLVTPVPPREEQAEIVAHVAKQCASLDGLIREASKAVELLKERRTALVHAAVTGQIDVRPESMRTAA